MLKFISLSLLNELKQDLRKLNHISSDSC